MIHGSQENKGRQQMLSYSCLTVGGVLMYFSNWTWAWPLSAWLFPVFLLRFSRTQKAVTGLPVLFFVSVVIGIISMWNLLLIDPIPPSFRIISGIAVGVVFFIPFSIDRFIAHKLPGHFATLIFPCSWVALEYVKALGNGSWGALAYTQYGNLPLMQFSSIIGIWGLSFLITWFASIVNFVWENKFAWFRIRKVVLFYGVIVLFVFIYGYSRLSNTNDSSEKICIASITNPQDFVTRFYGPDWTDRTLGTVKMQKDLDYFINETRVAAQKGAKIVFWQEYSISVMEENEKEFIDRIRIFVRKNGIFISATYGLFPMNYPEKPWKNKLVWVNPNGEVINEYLKSKPAPPLEPIIPGKGIIPVISTPYGKIASVICADQDYPNLILQAGRVNAQLLLIPAQDWKAVDPLHTRMGIFRAIENGFPMIKGTGGGLSVAVDPYGRVINSSDYFNSSENYMISCIDLKSIKTLYSIIGDAFAWLCILSLIVLSAIAFLKKKLL